MYSIERKGFFRRQQRLVAPGKVSPADFDAIAAELGIKPMRARKIAFVSARAALAVTPVETVWKGEQTRNTAAPGDWIVTNLSTSAVPLRDAGGNANTYVIKPDAFARLYDRADGDTEFGPIYRGKAVVEALLFGGGFDILAPWGERQTATAGYLLKNGAEVYGNERATFEETYRVIA